MRRPPASIGLVLDLDDTLYLERDYAFSGFRAVGDWLRRTHGIDGLEERARQIFETGERTRVFDAALESSGVSLGTGLICELLGVYRSHTPLIHLADDAVRLFERWPESLPMALLTDGFHKSQQSKVLALTLDRSRLNPIVYTDLWGPDFWKPHVRGFKFIASALGLSPHAMVYVADNPAKDFVAPKALGWRTVQIVRQGGVHAHLAPAPDGEPDTMIMSLDELDRALTEIGPPLLTGKHYAE